MDEFIKMLNDVKRDRRKRRCLGIFLGLGSLGLGIGSILKLIEAGQLDGIAYTLEEVLDGVRQLKTEQKKISYKEYYRNAKESE